MKRVGLFVSTLAVALGLAGCQTPRFCNRGAPCATPAYATPAYATCAPAATCGQVTNDCGTVVGQPVITTSPMTVTPGTVVTPGPETYAPVIQ